MKIDEMNVKNYFWCESIKGFFVLCYLCLIIAYVGTQNDLLIIFAVISFLGMILFQACKYYYACKIGFVK